MTRALVFVIGVFLYLWALVSASENLLSIRSHEILSLPIVLFPSFYAAVIIMIVCAFWATARKDERIATASVLSLGIMIWLTPYLLSFLPRLPDALFYTKAALSFPQLSSEETNASTLYAQSYPGSFALNYIVLSLTGIDALLYARIVYPVISVLTTLVLWYSFCSRIVGRWIALLATMLALPGLQYVEFHLSPHSAGVILVLTVLLLSCSRNRGATALAIICISTLITTYPIGPLVLAMYFAGTALATHAPKQLSSGSFAKVTYVVMGWFGWLFLHSLAFGTALSIDARQLLMSGLGILQQTSIEAVGAGKNIYPEIPSFHAATIYMYILVALLVSLPTFLHEWPSLVRALRRTRARLAERSEAQLAAVAFLFAMFAIALGLFDPSLRERSLFFFVLFASVFIVSRLLKTNKIRIRRIAVFLLLLWICTLAAIYPLIAYYGENYASPLYSEGSGMNFLARNVDLAGKTISMQFEQQLVYYSGYETYYHSDFPPQLHGDGVSAPQIVVFRESAFFYFATLIDLSMVPKTYTDSYRSVSSIASYNMVYASSTVHLFVITYSNASSAGYEESIQHLPSRRQMELPSREYAIGLQSRPCVHDILKNMTVGRGMLGLLDIPSGNKWKIFPCEY